MIQTSDNPCRNNNLFSNYYLEKYIPGSSEWKKNDHIAVFEQIKNIYNRESASIKTLNEKQLENHFFNEVFSILGFVYEVTEPTEARNFPDYAFFFDRNGRDDAHKNKATIPFFTNAVAIGEVKQWKVDLDKVSKNEYNISENPSLQIWTYLDDTQQKWGILSNGRIWRLYCKARRRDNYLEIDLSRLIESNDIDTFRFFYYFFRKDAFVTSKEGPAFLDRVLNKSQDYAQKIGDDLKENVYLAMKRIAEGFTNQKSNHLDSSDPATLSRVQNNTMILLYRFLFLLYAEGKGLLDLRDERYREYYSFHHIKHDIAETQDGPVNQRFDTVKSSIQADLKVLFKLVDQGSESFEIPKTEYYIPAYNGGLFDPEKHPDLEKWEIADRYLADAIDLISRSKISEGHRDFVDYSTLEIRNLGSIYEGLLEYKLKVAGSDLVVGEGGWVTLDACNASRKQKKSFADFAENYRVNAGNLYLVTDKGERKSSGSYYTPDYIVNYIVKNTIGPIVEQKWKDAKERNENCIDATLSINVLDPAMGSGHFLVGAVDFLSQKLMEAVQKDFEAGKIADTAPYTNDWARRDVVSHCIYGVDLNELAVELAKVGLWLTTISRDKPLSFLDHRLKQGNSLIGAKITDLAWYHEGEGKSNPQSSQKPIVSPLFVEKILNKISEIEKIGDDNLDDIKKKENIFRELENIPEYQKVLQIADLNTSFYFGNKIEKTDYKIPASFYYDLIGTLYGDELKWIKLSRYSWFKKSIELRAEKSFFHWELEFPEIFFDAGKLRENPGWDAVIGNPPYIGTREMSSHGMDDDKAYLSKNFISAWKGFDIYVPFCERGLLLLNKNGEFGFIIPNKLWVADYGEKIVNLLLSKFKLIQVVDVSKLKVFPGASVYPHLIFASQRNETNKFQNIKVISKINKKEEIEDISKISNVTESSLITVLHGGQDIESNKNLIPLREIGTLYSGTTGFMAETMTKCLVDDVPDKSSAIPFLVTGNINRYEIIPGNVRYMKKSYLNPYCIQDPKIISGNKWTMFRSPKIILGGMVTKLESVYDDIGFALGVNVYSITDCKLSPHYLVSLINSKYMTSEYRTKFESKHLAGGYLAINKGQLEQLPIRRISFTTPTDRRICLVNEAKKLFQSFTQNPDPQPLLAFIEARLAAQPEESDVVHDLLAFLAEKMVDMNKAKNTEIKTFLNFVESEIGASVDVLSNKTLIQEYYANDFTKIVDVLVKNKSKIKVGYNPKSPTNRKNLEAWHIDSCGKLKPLMANIVATDALIDQIVYKLYGLTEEEITIVEGK